MNVVLKVADAVRGVYLMSFLIPVFLCVLLPRTVCFVVMRTTTGYFFNVAALDNFLGFFKSEPRRIAVDEEIVKVSAEELA